MSGGAGGTLRAPARELGVSLRASGAPFILSGSSLFWPCNSCSAASADAGRTAPSLALSPSLFSSLPPSSIPGHRTSRRVLPPSLAVSVTLSLLSTLILRVRRGMGNGTSCSCLCGLLVLALRSQPTPLVSATDLVRASGSRLPPTTTSLFPGGWW